MRVSIARVANHNLWNTAHGDMVNEVIRLRALARKLRRSIRRHPTNKRKEPK